MAAGGAAGGAAAAMASAIKASGSIVQVEPEDFMKILSKIENPIIVFAKKKVFKTKYQLMTHYRGFTFYALFEQPPNPDSKWEIISAKKIWVPSQ